MGKSGPCCDILVVDDDYDIRETLTQVLQTEGYRVEMAANGQEALDRLKEKGADLVLLDLRMPVMNGWQFRKAQLRDPKLVAIPVVVISAEPMLRHTREQLKAECITKPVLLDRLLATVNRYLQ
jgi:CheY-like chemotaxis protein